MQDRKSMADKCFTLIKMFETGRPITVSDVSRKLHVNKKNAKRWIDEVSFHLPIYEYATPETPISRMNPIRYILRKD